MPSSQQPSFSDRTVSDGEDRTKREYACKPSGYHGCGKVSIDQRGLDELAAALVIRVLSDPRHASQIAAAAARHEQEAARLDADIAEAEGVAEALAGPLGRGELTLARHDAAVKPLDVRLGKLRAEHAVAAQPCRSHRAAGHNRPAAPMMSYAADRQAQRPACRRGAHPAHHMPACAQPPTPLISSLGNAALL